MATSTDENPRRNAREYPNEYLDQEVTAFMESITGKRHREDVVQEVVRALLERIISLENEYEELTSAVNGRIHNQVALLVQRTRAQDGVVDRFAADLRSTKAIVDSDLPILKQDVAEAQARLVALEEQRSSDEHPDQKETSKAAPAVTKGADEIVAVDKSEEKGTWSFAALNDSL